MKKVWLKKEAKIFLVSFLVTVAVIFLIIGISVLYFKNTKTLPPVFSSLIEKVTNTETSGLESKLPMNILVLGGDEKEGGRSDTLMLIRIQRDFQPVIISIPRDTRVKIEGVRGYSKINAAYAYGKSKLAIKTVEDLLGIKIDRYVALNYEAVKKIVDTVGGVDVEVPFHLYYKDTTPGKELLIDIPAGLQHLDGEKAVEFLRWRHNSDGKEYGRGGDLGRIEMQKKFVFALIDKVLKPQNLIKLPTIIQTATKYVDHNFTRNEIIWFVQNAGRFSSQNIVTVVMPGYPKYIDGVSYYILDEEKVKQLVEDLDEPELVRENFKIKLIGEKVSQKAVFLENELESKGYINVTLVSQKSVQSPTIELKRVNRKYVHYLMNDIDFSTFQVVYKPDYADKYDVYIKVK